MSSPVWNKQPAISQTRNVLTLDDRGDWTTQEGAYPARTCILWQRQVGGGWENVWGSAPPQRTKPDDMQAGEQAYKLPIGPENESRKIRAQVWAGVESSEWDDGTWIEWGTNRSTRPDPAEPGYSNIITVAAWGQPQPTPPAGPTGDQLAHDSLVLARKAVDTWQRAGVPASKIAQTAAAVQVAYKAASAETKAAVVKALEGAS